jgi:iron complex outermembrane receptor protein
VGGVALANGIVGVNDIFEAETADTFEAGLKAQLFSRHVTFNASAYTTKSKNGYFFVFLAANSTQNLGNVPEVQPEGFRAGKHRRIPLRGSISTPRWASPIAISRNSPIRRSSATRHR